MLIKFDKMQSLGNDFVMIDMTQFQAGPSFGNDFFQNIGNRQCGIGCDLTVLYRLQDGDIRAEFFNSDGSEAEICGNAARCLGFLMKKRHKLSECNLRTIKRSYSIQVDELIRVNMGQLSFNPKDIGLLKSDTNISALIRELGLPVQYVSCVSIGNPHLILFYENLDI